MNITTYQLTCERNVLDKTNFLQAIGTMTEVVLKDTTSVLHPTLLIAQSGIITFNYLYIEEFSRYYYVDSVSAVRNGVWEVTCSVDVLMSHKDAIENQTVIVNRCASEYDALLKDTEINKIYPTVTIDVDTDSVYNYDIFEDDSYADANYLYMVNACPIEIKQYNSSLAIVDAYPNLSVYGYTDRYSETYSKGFPLKAPDAMDMNTCASNVFFLVSASDISEGGATIKQLREIVAQSSSPNNILSIRHYPLKYENVFTDIRSRTDLAVQYSFAGVLVNGAGEIIASSATGDGVTTGCDCNFNGVTPKISYFRLSTEDSATITEQLMGYMCYNTMPMHILAGTISLPSSSGSWKEYSPYTKYYVWLPFYGLKEIDYSEVAGKLVYIYYSIDWNSGSATITGIVSVSTSLPFKYKVLFEESIQIAQDIPFNSTNYADIIAQQDALNSQYGSAIIGTSLSMIGSAIAFALAPATGGASAMAGAMLALGVASGTGSIVSTLGQAIGTNQSLVERSAVLGSAGTIATMAKRQKIFIVKVSTDIEEVEGANEIVGRPLLKEKTISEIGEGFFNCAAFHLDNFPNAWTDEINEINRLLLSGIIKRG